MGGYFSMSFLHVSMQETTKSKFGSKKNGIENLNKNVITQGDIGEKGKEK